MSISFESAVETLKIMFPDWDEEILSTILVSNNYHVENTIEAVLSMSGEEDTTPSSSSTQTPNSAPPLPQPSTGNLIDVDGSPTTKHSHSSVDSSAAAVGKPSASVPSPSSNNSNSSSKINSSSSSSNQYRGLRVELPFDFLRPPGWVGSEQMIADEDLARMLQNEMFQQEAMRVEGGAELIAMMQRSSAQNRLRQQQRQQHPSTLDSNTQQRRPSQHPASASSSTAGHSNEPVDLGIMKALNTMGTATKQSLSQLAQAFKSKTPAALSSSDSNDIHNNNNNNNSNSTASGTAAAAAASTSSASSSPPQSLRSPKQSKSKRGSKAFQSLEDEAEINHEDIYGSNDSVEVITFGSPSSNQHMLHGADDINGNDDDDAENPLLRQRGIYNNNNNNNYVNVNLNKKSY